MKTIEKLTLITLSSLTMITHAGAGATGGGHGATTILPFKMHCSVVYQTNNKSEKDSYLDLNFDEKHLLLGEAPVKVEVTPICQNTDCPNSKRYFVRASFSASVDGKSVVSSASTFVTKEQREVRFMADTGVCDPDCRDNNVVRTVDVTCTELTK